MLVEIGVFFGYTEGWVSGRGVTEVLVVLLLHDLLPIRTRLLLKPDQQPVQPSSILVRIERLPYVRIFLLGLRYKDLLGL
jgi:hypothetical protein